MEIRIMKIEDYDAVYALWLSCRGMGLNDLDDSREGIERFLKRNPDTCFVAEINGCIAGVKENKNVPSSTVPPPFAVMRIGVDSRLIMSLRTYFVK